MKNAVSLLELYRSMRRIRTFEEHVGELYVRQLSAGSMLHLSIGEEGAAAAVRQESEARSQVRRPACVQPCNLRTASPRIIGGTAFSWRAVRTPIR